MNNSHHFYSTNDFIAWKLKCSSPVLYPRSNNLLHEATVEGPPNPHPSAAAAAADGGRALEEDHNDSLEKISIPLADG